MTTSHDPNLDVSVSLDALPGASDIFQTALLAVPLAANSLDGDRVRSYADADDVADDLTAAYISATTAAQLTAAFSQTSRSNPPLVKVAYVDLAGGTPETYDDVIPTIRAADDGWYAYAIQNRTGAIAEAVSTAIQSTRKIFGFQSADADWLTAGVPAAYADLAAHERTIGFYHDDDDEAYDMGAFGAGLKSPDSFSAPWTMNVGGVAAYTTALTAGQRVLAIANNINILGQYGSSLTWSDPGTNIAGRTMRAIVARDWLQTRIEERVYSLIITKSNRLDPLEVSRLGQTEIGNVVQQVIDEGIELKHFTEGTGDKLSKVSYPSITATDVSLRRVRVNAAVYYIVDGRLVEIPVNMEAFV